MLTLEQMRSPPTRAELLEFMIDELEALGFTVTAWQDGSPQKTLLAVFTAVVGDLSEVVKQICEFGFSELSFGDALREISRDRFDNTKNEATKAAWTVRLTSTATIPYTIQVGQLRFTTTTGKEFINTTGGTLNAGGILDVVAEASLAGLSTISVGAINILLTPLAGVTCSNTAPLSNGNNAETDAALKLRNRTKWARLSVELTRDAYINLALNADPDIRKADVDDTNPRGAGTIDVYIAGEAQVVSAGVVESAQDYFAARVFQTDAYPPASDSRVHVIGSAPTPLNIAGTVYYDPAFDGPTLQTRVSEALDAFVAGLPLGGLEYPPPGHLVPKNEIENAIRDVDGVKTVVLTSPPDDAPVPAFNIVTLGTLSLSFIPTSG